MITVEELNNKFSNIKLLETDITNYSKRKLKFNCYKHGDFEKRAADFLKSKYGCSKCAMEFSKKARLSNTNDFLKKIQKKCYN